MQYNVEECYEKLKNGYDESTDMSDFDGSLLYSDDRFTNAQPVPEGRDHLWSQTQPHEMSPSHFQAAPSWQAEQPQPQKQLPYPTDDPYDKARLANHQAGADADAGEWMLEISFRFPQIET